MLWEREGCEHPLFDDSVLTAQSDEILFQAGVLIVSVHLEYADAIVGNPFPRVP